MEFNTLAQESLDQACDSLLPTPLEGLAASDEEGLRMAAMIGFAGDQVRGTLGVAASSAGIERLKASLGPASRDQDLADSLGELSNLLLGHVKRTWGRRGIDITLTTPIVMRGVHIEVCGQGEESWFETNSIVGPDRMTAWLDIHLTESLEVQEESFDNEVVSEGETLLF